MPYLLQLVLVCSNYNERTLCDSVYLQLGSACRVHHNKEVLKCLVHSFVADLNSCLQEASPERDDVYCLQTVRHDLSMLLPGETLYRWGTGEG